MIQAQSRQSWRKPLFIFGGLVVAVLLIFGGMQLFGGRDDGVETAVSPTTNAPAIAASTSTATVTLAPTETVTMLPTATIALTETAVPSNTPSPTAQLIPSATPLPENMAITTDNASIFAQADAASSEVAVIMPEEMVTVVGRSENSNWLYVQDEDGNRGFIFIDLLTWGGEVTNLPIRTGTIVTETTAVPTVAGAFSLDIYQLNGTELCGAGSSWTQQVYMRAQGVSGTFNYYWEGELVGTAVDDNITFEISSSGGAIVGTGSVIVDGAEASQQIFVPPPPCSED
jgi:hypothetical protein